MTAQLRREYSSSSSVPVPAAWVIVLMLYGLVEYLMVFRSRIKAALPIAMPSRPPASDRDFEKVWVTSRLLYSLISPTALSVPKSTYASSITTTLSGLLSKIFLIFSMLSGIPVGALGFAIKMVLLMPQ